MGFKCKFCRGMAVKSQLLIFSFLLNAFIRIAMDVQILWMMAVLKRYYVCNKCGRATPYREEGSADQSLMNVER